ncbi:MAG: hypothetical protein QW334_00100 [Thermofilum sp.]
MRREIIEKILEVLKSNPEIASQVKYFYFGRPVKALDWPFIVVEPAAAVGVNISDESHDRRKHVFPVNILVYARSVKEDEAEKTALDLVEKVYAVIVANPTLDNLVVDAALVTVTPEAPPLYEGEYAISVQRLTLEAWWLE